MTFMKHAFTTLTLALVAVTTLSACKKESSSSIKDLKYFRTVNGNYVYTVLFENSSNDVKVSGLNSLNMTPEGGASQDITSSVDTGQLSDNVIDGLKLIFESSAKDFEDLRPSKDRLIYVDIQVPQIPKGTTQFDFSLKLSDGSEVKKTSTLELEGPVFN